jgi:anaerobic magnesium-protoporphyrin IX monomethyl ester cyclase
MKVLLVNPPFTLEDRYGKKLKIAGPLLPSLGLAYIAAVLERDGHDVEILDAPALDMHASGIAAHVSKKRYDVIGVTAQTPMYGRFVEALKAIRPAAPDAVLMAGGPHSSIMPKEILLENPELDYSIYGEGEVTVCELMKVIEGTMKPQEVSGIGYRDGREVRVTPPRPFIKDIDDIPMPARHLLPMKRYRPAPSTYKRTPLLHMITSRGCPFSCVYCSSRSIFGRVYRAHSPKRVADEMEMIVKKYGAREIFFLDDIFTLDRKWATAVCDEIIRRGLHKKVEWSCSTRVNVVDQDLLLHMRKAGCWQIHYGLESGSQRLLDYIKKGITLEQSRMAVRFARKAGIQVRAYFMVGLPTETREETLQTIKFAKDVDPDYAKFSLTTPYPGTPLFDMANERGEIKSFSWSTYKTLGGFTDDERPYIPRGRTGAELKFMEKKAYRDFYLRPSYAIKKLMRIRSPSELIASARGVLGLM